MDKIYRVNITEVDPETGTETEVLNDNYAGLTLSADCGDGRMAEVIMHDTIYDLSVRLAQGEKTSKAVRLANALMAIKQDKTNNFETTLMRAIMEDM